MYTENLVKRSLGPALLTSKGCPAFHGFLHCAERLSSIADESGSSVGRGSAKTCTVWVSPSTNQLAYKRSESPIGRGSAIKALPVAVTTKVW